MSLRTSKSAQGNLDIAFAATTSLCMRQDQSRLQTMMPVTTIMADMGRMSGARLDAFGKTSG
jgi:hypothetical protein